MHVTQKAILRDKDGRILTIRRTASAPAWPETWGFPGGEVDEGENPRDAMIREIQEETGLEAQNLALFDARVSKSKKGECWLTFFWTGTASGEVRLSFEHDQCKWVKPDEFLSLESRPLFREVLISTGSNLV